MSGKRLINQFSQKIPTIYFPILMISLPFSALDIIINTYEKIPLSQDEHFLQDTERYMWEKRSCCN